MRKPKNDWDHFLFAKIVELGLKKQFDSFNLVQPEKYAGSKGIKLISFSLHTASFTCASCFENEAGRSCHKQLMGAKFSWISQLARAEQQPLVFLLAVK